MNTKTNIALEGTCREKPSDAAVYCCVPLFGKDKLSDLFREDGKQSPWEYGNPKGYCGGGNLRRKYLLATG
jgi:hypothetical protein